MADTSQARWALGLAAGVIGVALAILGLYEVAQSKPAPVARYATSPMPRGFVLTVGKEA